MTIGLVYAMPGEIETLLTDETRTPIRTEAGVSFYQIRPHIIACCCGVSKVNAAMGAQLLISLYHPDLVLNAGVAGCFENVPIGTIVLAEGFVQHDVDTTAIGDPVGLVSTVNRFSPHGGPACRQGRHGCHRSPLSHRLGGHRRLVRPPIPPAPTGSPTPSTRCCARWRAVPWHRCACGTG